MKKTLLIMAAGIGSRFGGSVKQIEPIGPNGEIIIHYSIFDALKAGFDKIVFVIRKDIEADFKKLVENNLTKNVKLEYVIQDINDIPKPYKVGERTKPWGTAQAVLACKNTINEPFAVINADDFYGKESFEIASNYLEKLEKKEDRVGLLSFKIQNTLSENGGVTRGIVRLKDSNQVSGIDETSNIIKKDNLPFIEDENKYIDGETPVSMNFWCLHQNIFDDLEKAFPQFLSELEVGDLKKEFLLPIEIDKLLKKDKIKIDLLTSNEKWFGVTFKEDISTAKTNIKLAVESGKYPKNLF
ncbi:MAG: sugar phosphate nucleotidyltransferase [Clostridia bacterium]|nr:sugar phosphate nucleotidyltransferase [Clostridia bacterium]